MEIHALYDGYFLGRDKPCDISIGKQTVPELGRNDMRFCWMPDNNGNPRPHRDIHASGAVHDGFEHLSCCIKLII